MRRSCQMAQCTLIACEALCMFKKGHIFAAVVSGGIPVGYGGCLLPCCSAMWCCAAETFYACRNSGVIEWCRGGGNALSFVDYTKLA